MAGLALLAGLVARESLAKRAAKRGAGAVVEDWMRIQVSAMDDDIFLSIEGSGSDKDLDEILVGTVIPCCRDDCGEKSGRNTLGSPCPCSSLQTCFLPRPRDDLRSTFMRRELQGGAGR